MQVNVKEDFFPYVYSQQNGQYSNSPNIWYTKFSDEIA